VAGGDAGKAEAFRARALAAADAKKQEDEESAGAEGGGKRKRPPRPAEVRRTLELVARCREAGRAVLKAEAEAWEGSAGSADERLTRRMLGEGTATDKLGAMQALVQGAPV